MGATISWAAAAVSRRTTVKYGNRGVRYVYIAAVQPACRIMVVPRGGCRRGFASAGLGRVRRVGMFGAVRESSSMIFSMCGRIRVIRCRTNGRSGGDSQESRERRC